MRSLTIAIVVATGVLCSPAASQEQAPSPWHHDPDWDDARIDLRASLECASVLLMLDHGWWLRIGPGERSTVGYGALAQHASVEPGTFSASGVCAMITDQLRPSRGIGAAPGRHLFTVLFEGDPAEYEVARGLYPELYALFRRAYRHLDRSRPTVPAGTAELIRFWDEAFFLHCGGPHPVR